MADDKDLDKLLKKNLSKEDKKDLGKIGQKGQHRKGATPDGGIANPNTTNKPKAKGQGRQRTLGGDKTRTPPPASGNQAKAPQSQPKQTAQPQGNTKSATTPAKKQTAPSTVKQGANKPAQKKTSIKDKAKGLMAKYNKPKQSQPATKPQGKAKAAATPAKKQATPSTAKQGANKSAQKKTSIKDKAKGLMSKFRKSKPKTDAPKKTQDKKPSKKR